MELRKNHHSFANIAVERNESRHAHQAQSIIRKGILIIANPLFLCEHINLLLEFHQHHLRPRADAHGRTPASAACGGVDLERAEALQSRGEAAVNAARDPGEGKNCPPWVWPESCRLKPACSTMGSRVGAWLRRMLARARSRRRPSIAAFMCNGEECRDRTRRRSAARRRSPAHWRERGCRRG